MIRRRPAASGAAAPTSRSRRSRCQSDRAVATHWVGRLHPDVRVAVIDGRPRERVPQGLSLPPEADHKEVQV